MNNITRKIMTFAVIIAVAAVVVTATVTAANNYEVRPEIHYGVEGHKTDIERIVNAYERLMDRYMNLVEERVANSDEKLDDLMAELKEMNQRLVRIEKKLE